MTASTDLDLGFRLRASTPVIGAWTTLTGIRHALLGATSRNQDVRAGELHRVAATAAALRSLEPAAARALDLQRALFAAVYTTRPDRISNAGGTFHDTTPKEQRQLVAPLSAWSVNAARGCEPEDCLDAALEVADPLHHDLVRRAVTDAEAAATGRWSVEGPSHLVPAWPVKMRPSKAAPFIFAHRYEVAAVDLAENPGGPTISEIPGVLVSAFTDCYDVDTVERTDAHTPDVLNVALTLMAGAEPGETFRVFDEALTAAVALCS